MFNLRKKMKQVVQKVEYPFKSVTDPNVLVAEIHEAFDTATDKLLKEAKEILEQKDNDKGKRLKNLGFYAANDAVKASILEKQKEEKQKVASLIEHYSTYYPNNKFITEKLVEQICKKYGLLFGDACYYKGDVPEKNIADMESFKLRDEDKVARYLQRERYLVNMQGQALMNLMSLRRNPIDDYRDSRRYEMPDFSKEEPVKMQPSFKICAPENDFDTTHLVKSGYKLELHIPDPIVLQPVSGGYLIVTKWGIEGQDESLTNEKMN